MEIHLHVFRIHPDATLPRLGTPQSVGADVHAYAKTETGRPSKILIPSKATRAIPTGIVCVVDQSPDERPNVLFVCSRSGMAKERSLFVINSPGIIDPDYRGEIVVLLYNGSHEAQYIEHGDRIAQLVIVPCPIPLVQETGIDLRTDPTSRGERGFGSTGR